MKLLFSLLLLSSIATAQTFPLATKDTLAITYRDSLVTTTITQTYRVPVFTVKPYVAPPVVVDPPPVVTPPVTGYQLTFQSGFDTRADITTNNGQYGRGVISTTKFVTGPGSFYSIPENVSSGVRSEVQYTAAAQNPKEGMIEYDVFYEVANPSYGHSLQWHPETSGASASPGLLHVGGKFYITRFKNGGSYNTDTGVRIPVGKWLHFRWEYKFANSNAYLRVYMDDQLIYDQKQTASSWLGDGSGEYLKVGWNGWDVGTQKANTSRIYYDNLKIYKKL